MLRPPAFAGLYPGAERAFESKYQRAGMLGETATGRASLLALVALMTIASGSANADPTCNTDPEQLQGSNSVVFVPPLWGLPGTPHLKYAKPSSLNAGYLGMDKVVLATGRSTRRRQSLRSIDAHVGTHLRARRIMAGFTQSDLATATGITFQQVQKYERAINRISASQLYAFARSLRCAPGDFFEGLDGKTEISDVDLNAALAVDGAPQLLRAFHSLDERDRNAVLTLAKLLSGQ